MNNIKQIMENYHSHLDYCRHGIGRASSNAIEAKAQGLKILGFSEHTPFPHEHPNDYRRMRMPIDELELYVAEINHAKTKSSIPLWLGMELDIGENLEDFYEKEIISKYNLDYTIGSIHAINYKNSYIGIQALDDLDKHVFYLNILKEACSLPLYDIIGHADRFYINDILVNNHKNMDFLFPLWQKILAVAKVNNKVFEFNTANPKDMFFCENSPLHRFWQEIAKVGINVIVSSDAHSPDRLAGGFDWAFEYLANIGITPISFYKFKTSNDL